MQAEFRVDDAVVKVTTTNSNVGLSVERPGHEGIMLYIPQALARAIASTVMGAAAELHDKGTQNAARR